MHKNGYFNNEGLMKQVEKAVDIFETKYLHAHGHFVFDNITRLRKIVPEGLKSCPPDMIWKYFRTCRDYESVSIEGCSGKDVEIEVKVYKSHRKVINDSS